MYLPLFLTLMAILAVYLLTASLLKKKFNINEEPGFQQVNKFHRWVEIILLASLITIVALVGNNINVQFVIILLFIFIFQTFRSFMLWKYEKEEKQWVFTLNFSFIVLLFLIFSVIVFL